MKNIFTFLMLLVTASVFLNAQTTNTYHETFENNNETGWVFTSYDASISTQNGAMSLISNIDEFFYICPPLHATKDDFSFSVSGTGNNLSAGGFGRLGLNSIIALQYNDTDMSIVYSENIVSYSNPNLTVLATMPIPADIITSKLDVSFVNNNMIVKLFINNELIFNQQVNAVDPTLKHGQMAIYLAKGDGPIEFSLDEIEIKFNPYFTPQGTFEDSFTTTDSPWFRFGDTDYLMEAININNGKLNFIFNGVEQSSHNIISPIGAVTDFTIELDGISGLTQNTSFGITRFFDMKYYLATFLDENVMSIGYANNSSEPIILTSTPVNAATITKIKFSVAGETSNKLVKVFVNNQLTLSSSLNIPNERLAAGKIAIGTHAVSNINVSIENVYVLYTPFIEFENGFAGGDGSASNPYLIETAPQLNNVRNFLSAHFRQIADINLGVSPWNSGEGWNPIGTVYSFENPNNEPFTGSYDGDGYKISNLTINRPDSSLQGLFKYCALATLVDMSLENTSINALDVVGSLAAFSYSCTISNCQTSGTVYGNNYIGGLIGFDNESDFDQCQSSIAITGNEDVGGLIGNYSYGNNTMMNCNSSGTVNGIQNVGGLVGNKYLLNLMNCTSTADVIGQENVGGLIGLNDGSSVTDCEASGNVIGMEYVGGAIGRVYNTSNIENVIASGSVQGENHVGGLVGHFSQNSIIDHCTASGNVFGIDPNGGDDLGGLVGVSTNSTIISNSSASGNVSGSGFNYVHVGGLVGQQFDNALISFSLASGNSSGQNRVGGLTGQSIESAINNSYARGSATGTEFIGGLVGNNHDGTITNCYSTGNTTGSSNTGGLVGFRPPLYPGTVIDSYWDTQSSNQSSSAGGEGRTTAEMKFPYASNTYVNWDFIAIWEADNNSTINQGYPFLRWEIITSLNDRDQACIPIQQYPNPFSQQTKIKFQLPSTTFVVLKIYDVLGNELNTLINAVLNQGSHEVQFNGTNFSGGVYIYRLQVYESVQTGTIVLLK